LGSTCVGFQNAGHEGAMKDENFVARECHSLSGSLPESKESPIRRHARMTATTKCLAARGSLQFLICSGVRPAVGPKIPLLCLLVRISRVFATATCTLAFRSVRDTIETALASTVVKTDPSTDLGKFKRLSA